MQMHQQSRPFPTKFKTVLCQYYDGTPTSCRFGAHCRYAHGQQELRTTLPPPLTLNNSQPQLFFPPGAPHPNHSNLPSQPPAPLPTPVQPPFFPPAFPGFPTRPWTPIVASRPPPQREFKPREYSVVKLASNFEVVHDITFTDVTAATQFFMRQIKYSNEEHVKVTSTFVVPNLAFAATGALAVFITGLREQAGKQLIDRVLASGAASPAAPVSEASAGAATIIEGGTEAVTGGEAEENV